MTPPPFPPSFCRIVRARHSGSGGGDAAALEAENRALRLQVEEFEQLLEDAQNAADSAASAAAAPRPPPDSPVAAGRGAAMQRLAAQGRQVATLMVELADQKRLLREAHVLRDESVAHTAQAERDKE